MKRRLVLVVVALLSASLLSVAPLPEEDSPALAFGGEDYLAGNPWYHPAFTYLAAEERGFTADAAGSIAWHSDYIDAYAYNPLTWLEPLVPDAALKAIFGYNDTQLTYSERISPTSDGTQQRCRSTTI